MPAADLPAVPTRIEQLEPALISNWSTSMAIGMLTERHHVDADAALAELRRISQNADVRLTEAPTRLIEDRTDTSAGPRPPSAG